VTKGVAVDVDAALVARRIEGFLQDQVEEFQRDGVVLGMSGGIDSAVVGALLCRALGPDRVLALLLPERDSDPRSKVDALREIERLGIAHREVDLTPMLTAAGIYDLVPLRLLGMRVIKESVVKWEHRSRTRALGEPPFRRALLGTRGLGKDQHVIDAGHAYARIKHRARMMELYYTADLENRLVVGTTNRSEAMTGFVVKWGDNVADVEPILPLYKTQVRLLAAHLGVPDHLISKAPTPDLLPGIDDEDALGIDYATLDVILERLDLGWDGDRIVAERGIPPAQVDHVRELVRRSRHLRHMPPSPDLGLGRPD
jgi:NAD+ synthase